MKLFVVFNPKNNDIIALSEDKKAAYMYILQNEMKKYQLSKIKDEKMIDKLFILYEDLIIEEFEDFFMTAREYRQIDKKIKEEHDRINNVIYDLLFMEENYKFSEKEKKVINKTIKILRRNSKKEKFYVLIMVRDFIIDLLGIRNKNIQRLFKSIESLDDEYYTIIIE